MGGWVFGTAAAALVILGAGGGAVAEPADRGRPVVHVCERGNYAERMLKREHGAAPFATAAEVLAVANSGQDAAAQGWTTPRCMTALEYQRLHEALRRAADERRARSKARSVLAAR